MPKHFYSIDEFQANFPVNPGRTLVVGSKVYGEKLDRRSVYPNAIGMDLFEGEGVDVVHNLESPVPEELGKFDHVDCCSVLEHCERPWLMCQNIEAALVEGGTLLLQVPFVWRVHNYPGDYWRFTTESFRILFPAIEWIKTGYLMNDEFRKATKSMNRGNKRFLQRSEAIGFGVKCTTS